MYAMAVLITLLHTSNELPNPTVKYTAWISWPNIQPQAWWKWWSPRSKLAKHCYTFWWVWNRKQWLCCFYELNTSTKTTSASGAFWIFVLMVLRPRTHVPSSKQCKQVLLSTWIFDIYILFFCEDIRALFDNRLGQAQSSPGRIFTRQDSDCVLHE